MCEEGTECPGSATERDEDPGRQSEAVQRLSTGRVETIDGATASGDRNKVNGAGVTEVEGITGNRERGENGRQDRAGDKGEGVGQDTMSRRPQVMRIADSATTACRPRAGDKQASTCALRSPRHPTSSFLTH